MTMKIDLRSIILAGAAMMADLMPSARAQYSVKRWEYTLADTAGNWSMPENKKEHHCILYDTKKQRISVVGTYGNFGYFEGSFKMGTNDASVTWWDTTITDSGMAPASGSAWLTYTDTMNNGTLRSTVTGGYSQNVPSPRYDLWLATDGSLKEDSSVDETAHEAFMEFCLLTKPRSKTIYMYMYMFVCVCMCVCVCVFVCVYIHIYIHIHTHICVCVYIYCKLCK
jgi:hypothetical protein